MLAWHADAASSLTALVADLDPAVRANAVWALGAVGTEREVPVLLRALRDVDAAVAANAAAAVGRVAARNKLGVERELCEALTDHRPALRESALSALRLLGKRCADGRERRVLSADRSPRARLAAALLLREVGGAPDDLRSLSRCVGEEVIGSVAAACAGAPSGSRGGRGEVLVFVVPAGETLPVPRAAFALVRPDGLTRHGSSDRRGAVCETAVPDGEIELATHAALGE
jgi:hypothetical protein